MKTTTKSAKDIVKGLTPPFLYDTVRSLIKGSKQPRPSWITLNYKPMVSVKLYLDPTGSWQQKMIDGSYDRFLFDQIAKLNPKGKTIYDLGAHIGYHSYYFAKLVSETGTVYAFEPNLANISRIEMILKNNPDLQKIVKLQKVAISDMTGKTEFNMSEDIESGRSSGNFIGKADPFFNKEVYKYKNFQKTEVSVTSLDDLTKDVDPRLLPDIIKIDIEGAEFLALKGATGLLERKKPVLFIEVHSMQNMFKIMTFLNSISYRSEIIHTENNGICYLQAQAK